MILKQILIIALITISSFSSEVQQEKRVVYSMPYIGTNTMFITTPVEDCSSGGCRDIGKWSFQLSDQVLDTLFESSNQKLLQDRFLTAIKVGDSLQLSNGKKVAHLGRDFQLGRVGYSHHKTRISRYINQDHFKIAFQDLINQKESYFFALYIDNIDSKYRLLPPKKGKYGIELQLDLTLNLAIYNFNREDGSFKLFREFRGESFDNSTFNSITTIFTENVLRVDSRPSQRDGSKLFLSKLQQKFDLALLDLAESLQKDRVFRDLQKAKSINGSDFKLSKSTLLGVGSVVGLYKVSKDFDSPIGWGKLFKSDEVEVISGTPTEESIILKYPWSGYLIDIESRTGESDFLYRGKNISKDSYSYLGLNLGVDIGYLLNNRYLYNLWFKFGGGKRFSDISYGEEDIYIGEDALGRFSMAYNSGYSYKIGLYRRFYIFSKLYISGGVEYGFEEQDYTIKHFSKHRYYQENKDSSDLIVESQFIEPSLTVGWSFSPNIELWFGVHQRELLDSQNSLKQRGKKVDIGTISYIDSDTFKSSSHINYSFGIRFNGDLFENFNDFESWSW